MAEQLAWLPPFIPAQVQTQEPDPLLVTEEAVPGLQRFVAGAVMKVWLLAEPQAPFNSTLAEQLAVEPPLIPAQVQTQEPEPLFATVEALPGLQRLDVGAVRKF